MARPRSGALAIFDALERHHPDADTELIFRDAFELLVATVLSAQSTDRRVNEVTPALFARYPTPATLAAADPADVEEQGGGGGHLGSPSGGSGLWRRTLTPPH